MLHGNGSICKVSRDGSSYRFRMELTELKDKMKARCSGRIKPEKEESSKVKELATTLGADQTRKKT